MKLVGCYDSFYLNIVLMFGCYFQKGLFIHIRVSAVFFYILSKIRQILGSSWIQALSPVNHKGLHQGWTQTSLCLQVIHFTSHHTTSHVFWAYLYSAGTQHGNLHPAGCDLFYSAGLHRNHVLVTANTGEIGTGFGKKCRWMDRNGWNKPGRNYWQ